MELNDKDIVELVYFLHGVGYIDRQEHDRVHELLFDMHVHLDETYGNWTKIEELVKRVRGEKE